MIWKTTIYAFVSKGLVDQVVVVISQAYRDTKLRLGYVIIKLGILKYSK